MGFTGPWALRSFVIINCCIVLFRLALFYRSDATADLTYVGKDYPITFPIGVLETVALTLQDEPSVDKVWETLGTHPKGLGRVHMGPDDRLFSVVMAHQLHCIREMERAFLNPNHLMSSPHHVQHCLNYLRQTLLCDAADSLEEGDFLQRDYEQDRLGDTLVCWDWTKVYDVLGDEFAEWFQRVKGQASVP
ncbi:hypothetical protein BV22DRAFT_1117083 [Leucogyrophana mollusca]|uniref:Uncharacterized protein n=1 Tax=Leucogyrophana mollusca TaxID=85980 RepID=A0ACB8BSY6_9AGAM|nr:hypothetical protein BV22DRAFT_1117083 [Leucogyrophana mollusca]